MKQIKLSGLVGKGKYALVDDADFALVSTFKWHQSLKGYAMRQVWDATTKKTHAVMLHHLIFGKPPKGEVDHINRNKLDNRRANLRLATNAQNQANRSARKNSKSGVKGVHFVPSEKKWKAQITNKGVKVTLGRFADKEAAALAYNAAATKLFGDFALLNKV